MYGSASHERRHNNVYKSIKILDQLTEQLKMDGIITSRSGFYFCLLPKRSTSLEGQCYVSMVLVKLTKAQNDHHAKHINGFYCTVTIRYRDELVSILGSNKLFFVSQDDKARITIVLIAANKKSSLLVHVEYRVTLPGLLP